MDDSFRGGCLCGAARFEARGRPNRVGLCHCLTCRKAHGAPFNAFAVFPRAAVVFVDFNERPLDLASLGVFAPWARGRQHFCRTCGSPLFYDVEGGEEVEIFLGSLDEPNRLAPTYESFTIRRETWLADLPGLLRHHERDRPGSERS